MQRAGISTISAAWRAAPILGEAERTEAPSCAGGAAGYAADQASSMILVEEDGGASSSSRLMRS
jgi:hypothetical protein